MYLRKDMIGLFNISDRARLPSRFHGARRSRLGGL